MRRRRAITLEDRDFIRGAAAWSATTDHSAVKLGLSRDEARRRAEDLIRALRFGQISEASAPLTDDNIDVLHAACQLLTDRFAGAPPESSESQSLLADAENLYQFASKARWPEPDFDERAEVVSAFAFLSWRIARQVTGTSVGNNWFQRFRAESIQRSTAWLLMNDILTTPVDERLTTKKELHLHDPEMLVLLLDSLTIRWDAAPARVFEEATFWCSYLEKWNHTRPQCSLLHDEREYLLGETARIAGVAARLLARRDEARRFFDISEKWFRKTATPAAALARLEYQRLVIRTEERDFGAVLAALPSLIKDLKHFGLVEEALKVSFLEAVVLSEAARFIEAIERYHDVIRQAKLLRQERLLAIAYSNLVLTYSLHGDVDEAAKFAADAKEELERLGNKVNLAKLQWATGYLFQQKGELASAIEAFRSAQGAFAELGMHADIAALQLVIADLLLDTGKEKQAEREIRQALPLIDEYKLVPEGFAAMTLLRESLRRQKIDRAALRDLHSHFENRKP